MTNNSAIIKDNRRNCPLHCANCPVSRCKFAAHGRKNAPGKIAGGLLFLLACFFLPRQATAGVTNSAGTSLPFGQCDPASFGYLKVFSSTQESQWGEGSFFYLHTGYRIYDSKGKVTKWVENHADRADEEPQKVELTPGSYTIWAQSDRDGYVKVPVVVKPDQTTTVHLENLR